MKIKKLLLLLGICSSLTVFTSCDTALAVLSGVADGMNAYSGNPYMMSTTTSSYSTYSGSSSSSSSSSSSCRACGGTGLCRRCKGAGKIYDYGPASAVSKEKYTHKCPVCNGSGKCGGCN